MLDLHLAARTMQSGNGEPKVKIGGAGIWPEQAMDRVPMVL
ncbi:hypothetical protein [Escherichia coli]